MTRPRCVAPKDPERVEVERGQTFRTRSGVAVTFEGSSHDSYEDGHADVLLRLVFRGVDEHGELTPSALTWRVSALARPAWHHLGIGRCARVLEPGEGRVVLELARPSLP